MKNPLNLRLTFSKKEFILKLRFHMRYTFLTVVLMLIAAIIGFVIGNLKPVLSPSLPQLSQNFTTQSAPKDSPLFDTQSATIIGSVTALNGNVLTITGQKNQSGQFSASNRMLTFKLSLTGPSSSPSADLKSVDLNKPAIFTLEKSADQYEVVSIRYLPK